MEYNVQHYYLYDEMMELLQGWVQAYPELMQLSSIGRSYQGRDIPLVTLTLGDGEKPAVLLSGNLHGVEIIGSCAVLYAIHRLLTEGKTDPELRALLQDRIIYCIPRINVDGAETNLTTCQLVRGSMLPFHQDEDGVVPADIDGDGVARKMRVPNPEGEWYASKLDSRVMMRVWPGMPRPEGVTFYDMVDEGFVRGPEKTLMKQARCPYDIDPNRSFPYDWDKNTEGITMRPCAGDYPLMDCETRALAQFVLAHPEITMAIDMHSYLVAYISPMEFCQDHDFDARDKSIFDMLGAKGTAISGYISSGIFPPEIKGPARGSFTTWLYYVLGIPAWCQEIGYPGKLYGGVDAEHPITVINDLLSEEEFIAYQQKLFQWDQEQNNGRGFMDWHPFHHPTLGEVELGGWDEKFVFWNLPGQYVEAECRDAFQFNLLNFRSAACLKLRGLSTADGATCAEIENTGLFPSVKSHKATALGAGDTGMITLSGVRNGQEMILRREKLPVLEGGETFCWKADLPEEEHWDSYRVTVEGSSAGVQAMEVK